MQRLNSSAQLKHNILFPFTHHMPKKRGLICQIFIYKMEQMFYTIMNLMLKTTVKPVLSGHSKRTQKIGFQYRSSLNAGQKYCRMLHREHSAILSTFIKLTFSTVLSIFKWLCKTGFTLFLVKNTSFLTMLSLSLIFTQVCNLFRTRSAS